MTGKKTTPNGYYRPNADQYYLLVNNGMTRREIAERFNVAYSTVTGGICEYKKAIQAKAPPDIDDPPPLHFPQVNPNAPKRKPKRLKMSAKPVAIRHWTNEHSTAHDFWAQYTRLQATKRFIHVVFPFDKHIPFHDPDAVALDHELMALIQPDVIVNGSDEFDFPMISRHEQDIELKNDPAFDDSLYRVAPIYREHAERERELVPHALKVFILGNHDIRFVSTALNSPTPKLLLKAFTDLVKAGGTHYIGNVQELLLNRTLFIRHDGGTGQNVANRMLNKDNSVNHVAGHTHRNEKSERVSKLFARRSMVVGCRCWLIPHYESKRGSYTSNWTQSLGHAIIDTETQNVSMTYYTYDRSDTELYTFIGTHRVSVPIRFEQPL